MDKKYFNTLFFIAFFYSLIGCNGYQSQVFTKNINRLKNIEEKAVKKDSTPRKNPYQIGQNWDRQILIDRSNTAGQIFQLYRHGMGAVGIGTYIGKIEGKHLVMTAAHTYNKLSSCQDEIGFIAKPKGLNLYFYCSGWSFQLKKNDILFFEINSNHDDAFDKLIPAQFSNENLVTGAALKMITIERLMPNFNFNWFIDNSKDCMLLADTSRYLKDLDSSVSKETSNKILSWSLPIGCDGKHGDSGAPVFDQNSGLVGVLWTGKYPKTNASKSLVSLSTDSMWSNFNYMVPMSTISLELKTLVNEELYISLKTRRVLQAIQNKIDNKLSL